jgi:hypothetical protein
MGMKLSGHYIILQYGFFYRSIFLRYPAWPAGFTRRKEPLKKYLTIAAAFVEIHVRRRGVQNAAPMRRFLSPRVVAFYTVITGFTRIFIFQTGGVTHLNRGRPKIKGAHFYRFYDNELNSRVKSLSVIKETHIKT